MKNKFYLVCISILSSFPTLFAQSPFKQWDARFGGLNDDYLYATQQTSDGGYIAGGQSSSGISGDKTQASQGGIDYWIVKVNSNGIKEWDARFGGTSDDILQALQQTNDGGYILGGFSASGASGDKTEATRGGVDYWIVKVNSSGVKEWDARFGGNIDDHLQSLQQTNDGGYILGGKSFSGNTGDKSQASQGGSDYWVVKVNSLGVKEWDFRFGGSSTEELYSLDLTNDGGYILGGFSASGASGDKSQNSRGGNDYWVVKINSAGIKQWDFRFGGSADDVLHSLQQTSDNGYILGGSSNSGNSGDKSQSSRGGYDYWIVKLNSSGSLIWDVRYGGNVDDNLNSLQQDSDGNYILGGQSLSGNTFDKTQSGLGANDYWIVKVSAGGGKLFDYAFGGSNVDFLTSLDITSDGLYILGGYTNSGMNGDISQPSRGGNDYWLVKFTSIQTDQLFDHNFCTGENLLVPYDVLNNFNSGNIFTAQLSDASGSFNSPTNIGTHSSTGSGSFIATIPPATLAGTGYRIRVIGSNPAITGSANNTDIIINTSPTATITPGGPTTFCLGENVSLTANSSNSYSWSNAATTQSIVVSTSGNYSVQITDANGCFSNSAPVTVTVNSPASSFVTTKQWDVTYGGSNSDDLNSIQQTADGGYIMGGRSNSGLSGDKTQPSQGGMDYWIVKTNSSGVKEWDARFGGSGDDELNSLMQTNDGGYILGGHSSSGISGDKTQSSQGAIDFWIVKVNSSGIKEWDARFGGSADDYLNSLQQTIDGGYILGGFSQSGMTGDKTQLSQGGADFWVVKINSSGVKQWDMRYGGINNETIQSVKQTSDGGYILGGYSYSGSSGDKSQPSQGNADYWVVKINSIGSKLWDASFGGNDEDLLWSLQQTSDAGYILGGHSLSNASGDKTQPSQGSSDFWIVKLNSTGTKLWDFRFGGSGYDHLYSLQQTIDGGYVLGGASSSGISGDKSQASQGNNDFWIVKLRNIPVISGSTSFCSGASTTLTASSGSNYLWSNGATTQSILVNAGGNFSVTVNSCYTSDAVTVTDVPLPNAIITPSGSTTLCPGESVILTANSADTYLWSTNETTQSITVSSSGLYTLTVTSNGCTNTASTNVTAISPTPKQWDKRFGGDGSDNLTSVRATNDGGYILGGNTNSAVSGDVTQSPRGDQDYLIVKTNNAGVKEWDARFGGIHDPFGLTDNIFTSVQQTSDGGYILGGYSIAGISGDRTQDSRGGYDYWILKTNASGIKVWDKRYGSDNDDRLYEVQKTNDGGYVLAGISLSGDISGDKTETGAGFWIVKIDASGNLLWEKSYFGGASPPMQGMFDVAYTIIQTNDGGYIFGGRSNKGINQHKSQPAQGALDYWIIKTDGNGIKQWDKTFGGSDDDLLSAIVQTSDGGYLLGGITASGISGDKTEASRGMTDFWIIKTDAIGNKIWDKTIGGNNIEGESEAQLGFLDQETISLLETNNGEYIIGGSSASGISGDKTHASEGGFDYWIIKIDAAGNKISDKQFGGSNGDNMAAMDKTNDGGFVVGGASGSGISGDRTEASQGSGDFWIIKTGGNPVIIADGPTTFCSGGSVVLTSGIGNNYLWSNGASTQSVLVNTSGNYSVTVDDCFISAPTSVTVQNCTATLNLNMFLQGYYSGNGLMDNSGAGGCLFVNNISGSPYDADTVLISAMNAVPPYGEIDLQKGILKTNGEVTVTFNPSVIMNNSYYLKIVHRNSVETWSKFPVTLTAATIYSFTTNATQAFGDNLAATLDNLHFAIYSGDINRDGAVDGADFLELDPSIQNGDGGYVIGDLNGDAAVDGGDFLVLDPNIQNGIGAAIP